MSFSRFFYMEMWQLDVFVHVIFYQIIKSAVESAIFDIAVHRSQRYKKMAEARCGASACCYYFLALCVWIAKPCYKYI